MSDGIRGQFVLVAAVAVAVALVPMLVAFLQLGYQPTMISPDTDTISEIEHGIERALVNITDGISVTRDWSNRAAVVGSVRSRFKPIIGTFNRSALHRGAILQVSYNRTLASEWAGERCPGGPARQFGPCVADRGIVVQERAGETHVLAIGLDIRFIGPNRRTVARMMVTQTGSRR